MKRPALEGRLLVGAEITPEDALPVLLYATDRKAYGHLARLITRGRRSAEKGNCILHFRDLAQHAEGVLAVVLPQSSDGREDDWRSLSLYRDVFADRCHLAAVLCKGPDDDAELDRLVKQARRARLPLVATNDVHYHDPDRRQLHEVLTAIRYGVTVAELGVRRFANAERLDANDYRWSYLRAEAYWKDSQVEPAGQAMRRSLELMQGRD